MYPNFNSNQNVSLSGFLAKRLKDAKQAVEKLTKGSFDNYNIYRRHPEKSVVEQATESIMGKFSLTALTLGSPVTRVEENYNFRSIQEMPEGESFSISGHNYRDLVHVKWQINGSTEVLGLLDNAGHKLTDDSSTITDRYVYPVGLKGRANSVDIIKARLQQDTATYQAHIDRLNTEIVSFNEELAKVIPPLVKAKYDDLNNLSSFEGLLNS